MIPTLDDVFDKANPGSHLNDDLDDLNDRHDDTAFGLDKIETHASSLKIFSYGLTLRRHDELMALVKHAQKLYDLSDRLYRISFEINRGYIESNDSNRSKVVGYIRDVLSNGKNLMDHIEKYHDNIKIHIDDIDKRCEVFRDIAGRLEAMIRHL